MGVLERLFGGASGRWIYETPTTALPTVATVRTAEFSFGVPWPWEQAPVEAVKAVEATPLVAVAALRTDGLDPLFCLTYRGSWDGFPGTDIRGRLDDFARSCGARPTGIRKVALAGAASQVLSAARGHERLALLLTSTQSGNAIEGFLRVPAPGYLHHFEAMLASWRWSRQ